MDFSEMSALQISDLIRKRKASVEEIVSFNLENIKKYEEYNSFITADFDGAMKSAREVQKLVDGGFDSPLCGVTVAVKDNICTSSLRTTCASKMLENFVSPYDAFAVEQMRKNGMVIVGKTNMDEFAMGSTGENSFFGAVKNPWDKTRFTGGSSSGSACAVSLSQSAVALGSDTGGSVRMPCAHCSLTGLKPTYGTVSRSGLVAYASSLDQIGTIAKTTSDAAALFYVLSEADKRDMTCVGKRNFSLDDITCKKAKDIKIAVAQELLSCVQSDVSACIVNAAEVFKSLGAQVDFVSFDVFEKSVAPYYIIACAEASSNLARYDGIRYGSSCGSAETLDEFYIQTRSENFGSEVKKRIMLGNFVLSEGYYDKYYLSAVNSKNKLVSDFEKILSDYDVLLSPVTVSTAGKLGENTDKMKLYKDDLCNVAVNLCSLPSLSLPCGLGENNMPVGCQLIGRRFDEKTLVALGNAFQSVTDFHKKKPNATEAKR